MQERIDDETGRVALATVRAAGVGNVGVADPGDLGDATDRSWAQNSPVVDQDPPTRVDPGEGVSAVPVDRATLETAVRYTLQLLADRAPGDAVAILVPPFGAVSCIDDPNRPPGREPDVIQTDAATWLMLAVGDIRWNDARDSGMVRASGDRADLTAYLPLLDIP